MSRIPFRKTYEETGYIININYGSMYHTVCADCYDDDYKKWLKMTYVDGDNIDIVPITLGSEWDAPGPVCEECKEVIECTPIYYNGEEE